MAPDELNIEVSERQDVLERRTRRSRARFTSRLCMKARPAQMKFHPRSHAHPRRRAPLRDTLIHTPLHLAPLDIYTLTHSTLTSE